LAFDQQELAAAGHGGQGLANNNRLTDNSTSFASRFYRVLDLELQITPKK